MRVYKFGFKLLYSVGVAFTLFALTLPGDSGAQFRQQFRPNMPPPPNTAALPRPSLNPTNSFTNFQLNNASQSSIPIFPPICLGGGGGGGGNLGGGGFGGGGLGGGGPRGVRTRRGGRVGGAARGRA